MENSCNLDTSHLRQFAKKSMIRRTSLKRDHETKQQKWQIDCENRTRVFFIIEKLLVHNNDRMEILSAQNNLKK